MRRQHDFHFDAVQMPLNVMDAHFRSFTHEVLPVLTREGIAPLGMKCFGDHYILDSNTVKPIECLHYCLNLPISVQITGIDKTQTSRPGNRGRPHFQASFAKRSDQPS